MTFRVKFSEQGGSFRAKFGAVQTASDGGFDRGYAEGYEAGYADGQSNPKPLGKLSQYVKIIAKPNTTTSFVIENPLGGIAKKVFARRLSEAATSTRKCQKYIADFDFGIAVAEFLDTSGSTRYTAVQTSGTVGNGQFKITEGVITLYRYNSANAWDNATEYEVEIYQ